MRFTFDAPALLTCLTLLGFSVGVSAQETVVVEEAVIEAASPTPVPDVVAFWLAEFRGRWADHRVVDGLLEVVDAEGDITRIPLDLLDDESVYCEALSRYVASVEMLLDPNQPAISSETQEQRLLRRVQQYSGYRIDSYEALSDLAAHLGGGGEIRHGAVAWWLGQVQVTDTVVADASAQ